MVVGAWVADWWPWWRGHRRLVAARVVQMLGCCTVEQLKYFCKHTKNHRTGAKDRVLYLTYLAICKQLDPKGPFHR
ncbi:hypothetical protein DCAR_0729067 [Daucus carota subsp. sativus]|uniref:DUF7086 domain-containing protein n=1 Tax=Daucus carota subsp. sativus TaxID=79200 RepID=A0A161ZPD0_DAUCS|nr:hypothetical protein DCAR_0729067 [Daucus carota subsp. sativus]